MTVGVACGDSTTTPAQSQVQIAATPTPAPTATLIPIPEPKGTNTPLPAPTALPTPIPTPTAGYITAGTKRLVVAHEPALWETNNVWKRGGGTHTSLLPMLEGLTAADRNTGEYAPRLALDWTMRPDGKQWTVNLRPDVPFHNGWGEFTSKEIPFIFERLTSEESISGDKRVWNGLIGEEKNLETPDDHTVVFNLLQVEPNMPFNWAALLHNMLFMSKAQWEAEGIKGYDAKPAGTGPYKYVERVLSYSLLYERVENHWRHTPEFQELYFRWVPEDSTRLAMILTGEAHIVALPRDLYDEASVSGAQVVSAGFAGNPPTYFFHGNYHSSPDVFDPTLPWTKKEVREALTKGIDFETINDKIFHGQGKRAYSHLNHPAMPGWDKAWEERGKTEYAYDPVAAAKLLADAGYPNGEGIEVTIYLHPWSGYPEYEQVSEAIAQYWRELGVTVDTPEEDFARIREKYKSKNLAGGMYGYSPSPIRSVQTNLRFNYAHSGCCFVFEHPVLDDAFAKLNETADPVERDRISRVAGEFAFSNYINIPLFYLPLQSVIDPTVVKSYVTSGLHLSTSDFEYVEATVSN